MYYEIGIPARVIVDEEKFNQLVTKYNGVRNIYETVYKYKELKEKVINYDSAIIDKVFFDFDGEGAYDETVKLHKFLKQKKLKHEIRFSGGGFHILMYLKNYEKLTNSKVALNNLHNHFLNIGFKFDKQIVGDIARMIRVPNTFNVKRGKYCIYINREDLKNGLEKIKEKAKEQSFKRYFYGNELMDIQPFDNGLKHKTEILEVPEEMQIKIDKDELLKELPPCIANMLVDGEMKYRERFYVISFLINKGHSKSEVYKILQMYLKKERFEHIMKDEKHIEYLFSKNIMFPSCKQIKHEGLCPIKDICKQIRGLYR
jgi:hypothetical protein